MPIQSETNVRIFLSEAQRKALREIAAKRGFVIGRGRRPKMGSINKLAQAIADGDLWVINPEALKE